MSDVNYNLNDDLSDLLGQPAGEPRPMPQDEQLVRIREQDHQRAANGHVERCLKCHGTGRFTSYSGRPLGECFACKGKGSKTFRTSAADRQQNRQRAAERKVRQANEALEAFKQQFPAEHQWMVEAAPRFEFAAKMLDAVQRFGSLTENQLGAVQRCVSRDAERAAQRAAQRAQQDVDNALDVTIVREALQNRKKFMVAMFTFSLAAPTGANPGAIYVKDSGQYIGKIPAGTSTFRPVREFDATRLPALREVMANPGEAARADAARRAKMLLEDDTLEVPCGCCGILLTNPESRARGIGPICASKWGF